MRYQIYNLFFYTLYCSLRTRTSINERRMICFFLFLINFQLRKSIVLSFNIQDPRVRVRITNGNDTRMKKWDTLFQSKTGLDFSEMVSNSII